MKSGEFVVTFNAPFYKKEDILFTSEGTELEVVKVYKLTWWKKVLMWFGVPFHSMDLKVKNKMKPTIGRIVHYFPTDKERDALALLRCNTQNVLPAIIVAVWTNTTINVKVFIDGAHEDLWKTSVVKFEGGDTENQQGKWDWPPREEAKPEPAVAPV